MKPIKTDQIKDIQILIKKLKWEDKEQIIVSRFTNERTIHLYEMGIMEGNRLWNFLLERWLRVVVINKIWQNAFYAGIIKDFHQMDRNELKPSLRIIDRWCMKCATSHKPLSDQTQGELEYTNWELEEAALRYRFFLKDIVNYERGLKTLEDLISEEDYETASEVSKSNDELKRRIDKVKANEAF
jgi:hypothetical protein